MEEWKTIHISDIGKIVTGKTPRTSIAENYGGRIPFLTPSDDLSGKYAPHSAKTLTNLGLAEVKNCLLPDHAICVSCIGSDLGKVVMTKQPTVTNQQFNSIIPNADFDPDYVYYLMTIVGKKLNYLSKTSTAVPIVNKSSFSAFEVSVPPLYEQKRIARILSSIDDIIALNNRINHNLEEQAQALYKSWFIDFEPFKDGKFIDSELGMIPNGWQVKNLLEISQLFDSKRKPLSGKDRDQMAKLYPYYGATSIMDYVDSYIFDGTYLLMGEDGSVITEDGYPFLQYVTGKFWPNNHAHVLQGYNGFSTEMLHCALLRKVIKSSVTGAVQAKISQANMRKILFPCPSSIILKAFDSQLQTLYCQKRCIEAQNANLASLRDSLLPQLISGQLTC